MAPHMESSFTHAQNVMANTKCDLLVGSHELDCRKIVL